MAPATAPVRPSLRARLGDAAGGLRGRRLLVPLLAAAVLLGGTAYAGARILGGGPGMRATAYFDRTVSVHEGSDIRILGVRVGRVDRIEPRGTRVRVDFSLDEGVKVPADAQAVVVAPSVVSGRFVQLTPAYTTGPELADGDVIPADRTATPLEVDELLQSVTELSEALGPEGANKDGALSELVETGARNLEGNGKAIGDSIEQMGSAAKVLSGNGDELVETVEQLQEFVSMLKDNDGEVRKAERQLAEVAGFLADDKDDLAAALKELGGALRLVKDFIQDNRGRVKDNVEQLEKVTRTVVKQRRSVAEALDTLPLAAANLDNAFNPATGTIDGRADINELSMGPGASGAAASGGEDLEPVSAERRAELPALPLPAVGTVYGTPASGPGQGSGAGSGDGAEKGGGR